MKLYHYVHCPFCVRVRIGFGILKIPYQSIVLPYNDEQTPLGLVGQKILPIIQNENASPMKESLDILQLSDANKILNWDLLKSHQSDIDLLLASIGSAVHPLCMPYWIWTPEFDNESRKYFQTKKETTKGPFNKLIQNKEFFLKNLDLILAELEKKLVPFYQNETLSIIDIVIASHLWGMYIFPEFQFPPKIHKYLQSIKEISHFEYHKDFWV
jgi:glutaredoxin 2